jgi:cytochrome P450
MTKDIMDQRDQKSIKFGDFIDRLREQRGKLEPPLTDVLLPAQGIVFLTAGFETTASTLGHLMYLLAKNPDIQDRVFDEVCQKVEILMFLIFLIFLISVKNLKFF